MNSKLNLALLVFALLWPFGLVDLHGEPQSTPDSATESSADSRVREQVGDIRQYNEQYVPQKFYSDLPFRYWVDVGILGLLMTTGSWLALTRRHPQWLRLHLLVSLLYFGMIRGGCICPVGASTNVLLGIWRPELVGLATLALFLIPLIFALLFGRVFCGAVCPLGAVQQWVSRKSSFRMPRPIHRVLGWLPVGILALTFWGAVMHIPPVFIPCQLDPFKPLFFAGRGIMQALALGYNAREIEPVLIWAGNWSAWGLLVVALLVNLLIPRFFCRYLCPYAPLLGLFSMVAFKPCRFKVRGCSGCGACQKICPVQAIQQSSTDRFRIQSMYQCIQCGCCRFVCKKPDAED